MERKLEINTNENQPKTFKESAPIRSSAVYFYCEFSGENVCAAQQISLVSQFGNRTVNINSPADRLIH